VLLALIGFAELERLEPKLKLCPALLSTRPTTCLFRAKGLSSKRALEQAQFSGRT